MERLRLNKKGHVDKRQFNGGNDPGYRQGRPLGAKNKMSVGLRGEAAKAHMASGGMMPLEFMLTVLRDATVAGGGRGKNHWEYPVTWEDKKWAAEKLLHCFTPKLTDSKIHGRVEVFALPPEKLKDCTPQELQVLEKVLGRIENNSPLALPSPGQDIIDAQAYEVELED